MDIKEIKKNISYAERKECKEKECFIYRSHWEISNVMDPIKYGYNDFNWCSKFFPVYSLNSTFPNHIFALFVQHVQDYRKLVGTALKPAASSCSIFNGHKVMMSHVCNANPFIYQKPWSM